MLTIIVSIVCGIMLWFEAFKEMNATCDGDNWSIFVYNFTKFMRYPFIAMAIDIVITVIIILNGTDDIKYALWDIGIYV